MQRHTEAQSTTQQSVTLYEVPQHYHIKLHRNSRGASKGRTTPRVGELEGEGMDRGDGLGGGLGVSAITNINHSLTIDEAACNSCWCLFLMFPNQQLLFRVFWKGISHRFCSDGGGLPVIFSQDIVRGCPTILLQRYCVPASENIAKNQKNIQIIPEQRLFPVLFATNLRWIRFPLINHNLHWPLILHRIRFREID